MIAKLGTRGIALVLAVSILLAAAGGWLLARHSVRATPAVQPAAELGYDPHAGHEMGGDHAGMVHLSPAQARALGVTFVTAELVADLSREVRTTGHVTWDETRLSTISPKFGGWVERLHVDFTGQPVRQGQVLFEIYSPELVSAQEELLAAIRLDRQLAGSAAPGVADRTADLVASARRRLELWDISAAQIQALERTGEVRRTLAVHSLAAGFVVEKAVQAGQRVEAGMPVYRLAALSRVWVEADVYESDLRFIGTGQLARVELAAYPGEIFKGSVVYRYPDVRPETRTARVRIELRNPGGRIMPGMFATVHLHAPVAERGVVVPRDAVMRTGARDVVFVETEPGMYEAREVRVGEDAGPVTQILGGLLAGERVVARANFIIDAESRLMESMDPGMHDHSVH